MNADKRRWTTESNTGAGRTPFAMLSRAAGILLVAITLTGGTAPPIHAAEGTVLSSPTSQESVSPSHCEVIGVAHAAFGRLEQVAVFTEKLQSRDPKDLKQFTDLIESIFDEEHDAFVSQREVYDRIKAQIQNGRKIPAFGANMKSMKNKRGGEASAVRAGELRFGGVSVCLAYNVKRLRVFEG